MLLYSIAELLRMNELYNDYQVLYKPLTKVYKKILEFFPDAELIDIKSKK